jgi:transcriptional regulator of acetoin/glycerol metabolism
LTLVELLRRGPDDSGSSFDDARVRWECEYLRGLLSRTDGNVSEASRRSGISREHLHRMMKKHSLSRRRVGG